MRLHWIYRRWRGKGGGTVHQFGRRSPKVSERHSEDLTIEWGIGAQLGLGAAMESHPSERQLQIWFGPIRLVAWWMR